MDSITRITPQVKSTHLNNKKAETLALADHALRQWQQARARFLATGDATAWRLAEAAEADRAALLREAERP